MPTLSATLLGLNDDDTPSPKRLQKQTRFFGLLYLPPPRTFTAFAPMSCPCRTLECPRGLSCAPISVPVVSASRRSSWRTRSHSSGKSGVTWGIGDRHRVDLSDESQLGITAAVNEAASLTGLPAGNTHPLQIEATRSVIEFKVSHCYLGVSRVLICKLSSYAQVRTYRLAPRLSFVKSPSGVFRGLLIYICTISTRRDPRRRAKPLSRSRSPSWPRCPELRSTWCSSGSSATKSVTMRNNSNAGIVSTYLITTNVPPGGVALKTIEFAVWALVPLLVASVAVPVVSAGAVGGFSEDFVVLVVGHAG